MRRSTLLTLALALGLGNFAQAEVPTKVTPEVAKEKGCMSCHEGIESIREETSAMLAAINLETAVGRRPGRVPGGVWQGTTRRNS